MTRSRKPLFVKRQSYRLRRLRDAARLLPVVGAFLVMLPILWSPAETELNDTAPDAVYIFLVWGALVLIAALLAPGLTADPQDDEPEEET